MFEKAGVTSLPKGDEHWTPAPSTPCAEAKLWRKVDWHILPILTVGVGILLRRSQRILIFDFTKATLVSVDPLIITSVHRGSVFYSGNAKLQGLTTQLDLTGNKYNIALVCAPSPFSSY